MLHLIHHVLYGTVFLFLTIHVSFILRFDYNWRQYTYKLSIGVVSLCRWSLKEHTDFNILRCVASHVNRSLWVVQSWFCMTLFSMKQFRCRIWWWYSMSLSKTFTLCFQAIKAYTCCQLNVASQNTDSIMVHFPLNLYKISIFSWFKRYSPEKVFSLKIDFLFYVYN